ncbi:valine--tRNA ligase [Peptostreptococcaceae bacterium oral taxon 113 str. W5053]|nr:valine--tRNA ligase [Peptostreptococcaceae bacterium oral taxon 113 str. W5053]
MENLQKTYNPKDFEKRIYELWEKSGCFHAEVNPNKKPYTIMMPPPNVTGKLHIGHALNNTIQDIFIRFKRMQGYEALWMPGMDHASISTEAKVVEKLAAEGRSKENMTREEFLEEAWEWTEIYGGAIKNQLKELGVSCDWERERFTLDEQLSKAVEEQFLKMYKEGLIYQGDRIINYCINCGTAISDAEVEHEDTEGKLYHIRYPYEDGSGEVIVATTRPETMLGDLAVAVHPEDERYTDKVGKMLILPLVNRRIPLIEDTYVDPEYGTGAVKITPSHDPNDFEVGEHHHLGQCVIIDEKGNIPEGYGRYTGMDRFTARKAVLEDLKAQGYFIKDEKINHAVGHCERCGEIIEPIVSCQWFVKMKDLAQRAKAVYVNGKMNITPDRFGKVYINWLDNIRDWCISRQLWWGHRIPVYYCDHCGYYTAASHLPETCPKCGSTHFHQDENTLDTWFSSALWPFSTLGWPDKTPELEYFYPTSVLVTGADILFFWVIRMVFSGLYSMDEIPFKDVYFTGLVRDDQGRKMSKSLGNGVDPLEVIDRYGADALRFTLITGNSPGNDMRFYWERVEANRNFANKFWNASRFVLMQLEEGIGEYSDKDLAPEDRWILTKLSDCINKVTENLEKKEIGLAAAKLYDFIWSEYCDWYIELVKPRLYKKSQANEDFVSKESAKGTLSKVLDGILKLLHPFMPFITEEIYSKTPWGKEMLMIQDWPLAENYLKDAQSRRQLDLLIGAVTQIRNLRNNMNIPNKKRSEIIVIAKNEETAENFEAVRDHLLYMGFGTELKIREEDFQDTQDYVPLMTENAKIYLPLKELIDMEEERKRLEKEKATLEGEIKRGEGKLSNPGFVNKAPTPVVEQERKKLAGYQSMYKEVCDSLKKINTVKGKA